MSQIVLNNRQRNILEAINSSEFATVHQLAVKTGASEATIRRDLDVLADGNYIDRVHGGALRSISTTYERIHNEKMQLMQDEKKRIAKKAAGQVKEGQSIFLDSGSTTYFIACELISKKNLTIVTDNLEIVYSVDFDPSSSVIFTGGLIRRDYGVVIGSLTQEAIKHFKVDVSFLACDAVDAKNGIYNFNYQEVEIKKEITKCGRRTILVTDHKKFESSALVFVCPLSDIDLIITDKGLRDEYVKAIKDQSIELMLV